MTNRLLLAAGVLAAGLAAARPAMAFTELYAPFGSDPVSARIGSATFGNTVYQVVVWQDLLTGFCTLSNIGDATGLRDDYMVNGTSGADRLEIQPSLGSNSFCGFSIAPLAYAGHFLDLDGAAGNDVVICASAGDSYVYGSDGNDVLISFNPNGVLMGGAGIDSIFADGSPANQIVHGGAGDDCLFSSSGAAQTFDCGDGTDKVSGTRPMNATSCELTAVNCPGSGIVP